VRLKLRRGNEEKEVEIVRTALSVAPIARLAFSPDGRQLAVNALGSITVWEPGQGSAGPLIHGLGWAMAFTPDGRLLAGRDGVVVVFDPPTGREVCQLPGLGGAILDLACAHDGRLAVLSQSGHDLRCHLLDVTALDDTPPRADGPGADRRQVIRDLTAAIESGKEKDAHALARLYHERGLLLAEEGDVAAAKRDLDRAVELDPAFKDRPR
jgi:hypothetical protein